MNEQHARELIRRMIADQTAKVGGPLPLHLAGDSLESLPSEIGQLPALTSLHAYRPGISSLVS